MVKKKKSKNFFLNALLRAENVQGFDKYSRFKNFNGLLIDFRLSSAPSINEASQNIP